MPHADQHRPTSGRSRACVLTCDGPGGDAAADSQREPCAPRHSLRARGEATQRQRQRQTEKEGKTETETETDRQRWTKTDRDRQRQTETETETKASLHPPRTHKGLCLRQV
eukprot:3512849-Rhodomonas_salina.1